MGISDNNAIPVLIFSTVYLGFISIIFVNIGIDYSVQSVNEFQVLNLSEQGDFSSAVIDASIVENFVNGVESLGLWSFLLFAPVIISLSYVGLCLAIPSII